MFPSDLPARQSFASEFLAHMEVDKEWPLKILCSATVAVTGQHYESFFCNYIILALQQHGCVDWIIYMQDSAPPHIANSVK